jgi:anaerobic selenocysteine-containing dehydrogenase
VRIQGDPAHPVTQGFLCAKVNRYLERTYHPERLTTPLRRVGRKGEGRFAPVSWDEALDEIAERLRAIAGAHGAEAILPYSYSGTLGLIQGGSLDRRFFHALGASRLERTICSAAGEVAMAYTVGARMGTDLEAVPRSDLVILWGTNTLTSNPHLWPFVLQARERGAPVIAIDPIRTRTAAQCDEWIPIRPGTDAALALGLMHVMFGESLQDQDYLERHTVGWDALRARACEFPPSRVASITGLPEELIAGLARRYAAARAGFIRMNYGLQRHGGGGAAVRAIAALPAVSGHWRHPGGGMQLSTSGTYRFATDALERPDLGPPARSINMIRLGAALAAPDAGVGGPPVKALVVYNSNPAAVTPDRSAVTRGLRRDDLLTVVLEHFHTDTADYADFVLPATTQLEHWDVHLGYGHLYVTLNRPAIAPLGESKPNTEIFRLLAARMGLDDPALRDDDATMIRQALDTPHERMRGITFERLLEHGWARLNVPEQWAPFAEGGFPTPSGRCELYSERMAAMGLDPVPGFVPPYEFPELVPELAARYPLTLISSPAHHFLNSSFVNVPALRKAVREPELLIHPDDALPRGIAAGARVRIHNDRGAFGAVARVEPAIRPGTVWAPSVWWTKLTPDGRNANDTTSQRESDLGGGAVFYDNLVDVAVDGVAEQASASMTSAAQT